MDEVIEILYDLYDDVQGLRESGEGDLRTVLMFIDRAISEVRKVK